eukprot:1337546-Alexandrium_andersonii.AAC.1
MSASLVGSEMCIRDRLPRSPLGGSVCKGHGAERGCGDDGGSKWWSGTATVSYTHLTLPTICSV